MQISRRGVASFPLWWERAELQTLQKCFVEANSSAQLPWKHTFSPSSEPLCHAFCSVLPVLILYLQHYKVALNTDGTKGLCCVTRIKQLYFC